MIPPSGFKSTLYPLRHKLKYAVGIDAGTAAINSTIFTLVKNYKSANAATVVDVNPSHASFDTETGAICGKMSIIDRLKLTLKFNLTRAFIGVNNIALSVQWTPIFFSFPEKLDAADDETTATVATILSLTKDATEEDITPAFGTKIVSVATSSLVHPTSSVNFTEVFGTLNLTTNTQMEGVPFDKDRFHDALKFYTNKGALKACIGQTRSMVLTQDRPQKTYHIDKFVPRAIRRIVPYTYFGILIHVPLESDVSQAFFSTTLATSPSVGVKAICTYDEWNIDHNQDMTG